MQPNPSPSSVSSSLETEGVGDPARLDLEEGFGWRRCTDGNVTLWIAGHVYGADDRRLAKALQNCGPSPNTAILGRWIDGLSGHFAIIAEGPGWTLAGVDWVRSIPLFYARDGGVWAIDNQAERLRHRSGLDVGDIDPDAALSIGMAGYTIDTATLYRGLEQLGPGELALFAAGAGEPERFRYYTYRPWRVEVEDAGDEPALRRRLANTTLGIFEKLRDSLAGRTLVVPLSAGLDSRLVVAAMSHLGHRNIRSFAYGRPGNFEAATSRKIAERLGIEWAFVPTSVAVQRSFFAGDEHRRYLAYADSCASVPFEQDLWAIRRLKESGYIPDDAVIANGNSGDYISGAHIVPALRMPQPELSSDDRRERVLDCLVDKHFDLWQALRTPRNDARIRARLRESLDRAGALAGPPEADHGLYEYAEFQDRQCKYVITGQRVYEFLGHDWRLPLWDIDYLRIWEGVPLASKAGQRLYRAMLEERDWGGVWRDVPVNAKTIQPAWLRPVRVAAKALHAPLGRERWHRFERRYFQYWMDTLCNFAAIPYRRVTADRRGHRNAVSWFAEAYLAGKGLDFGGGPVRRTAP